MASNVSFDIIHDFMTLLIAVVVASVVPTPRAVALAPTPRGVTSCHKSLPGVSSATLCTRAKVRCVAPALLRDEDNEVLAQLRHRQAQLRRLRRLAREKAIQSSSAVSSALHAEAKSHERACM